MKELLAVQAELSAPKGQRNNFGGYTYRSCEDILEAVKPLLVENGLTLVVSDELMLIGERYYVKATATVKSETAEVSCDGYAREEEVKKGMDSSQITGACSSYARKYALNGLFLIDDNKDSDTTNEHGGKKKKRVVAPEPKASPKPKAEAPPPPPPPPVDVAAPAPVEEAPKELPTQTDPPLKLHDTREIPADVLVQVSDAFSEFSLSLGQLALFIGVDRENWNMDTKNSLLAIYNQLAEGDSDLLGRINANG